MQTLHPKTDCRSTRKRRCVKCDRKSRPLNEAAKEWGVCEAALQRRGEKMRHVRLAGVVR
jgi:hypothetical protein